MLLDPRNGHAFDLPPPAGAPRSWVLASSPRTGSTLLCRALWDTGLVGAPSEYLNPMQVRDWEVRLGGALSARYHRALRGPLLALVGRPGWGDDRLRAYLDRVRARRTGPTGHFGLKLHHHHLEQWFLGPGRDPQRWLGEPVWVQLSREDRLAQAISWARALQTGQWASTQRPWMRPVYDRRSIQARLRAIERAEQGWRDWFERADIEPLRLSFEQLTADLPGTVRVVLARLGVADPARVQVPAPELRPQADGVSEAWRTRFLAEPATR